jgi:hypothetical protein
MTTFRTVVVRVAKVCFRQNITFPNGIHQCWFTNISITKSNSNHGTAITALRVSPSVLVNGLILSLPRISCREHKPVCFHPPFPQVTHSTSFLTLSRYPHPRKSR